MLELHITDSNVTSGNIAVGWCVDKETLQLLNDEGIKDPVLVLVVAPEGEKYHKSREYRKLVPLKDLVAYVEFRTPGKNNIWGFISQLKKKDATKRYMERDRNEYYEQVLSYYGDEFASRIKSSPEFTAAPVLVDVPEEVFAAEPSDFEKAWVNHFFPFKAFDQCEFRRRRLFAYTVQPLVITFSMLVRLLPVLVGFLCLKRNLSLKAVLHPLTYTFLEAFDAASGDSILVNKEAESFLGKYWKLVFTPIGLMGLAALIYLATKLHIASFFLSIPIAILALLGGWKLFNFVVGKFIDYQIEKDKLPAWYLDENEQKLIVCSGQKKPYSFDQLPSNRRSLRLRFDNLKSKVCRPFSA